MLRWAKNPVSKGHTLNYFIYVIFLKWHKYRDGEQMDNCHERGMVGETERPECGRRAQAGLRDGQAVSWLQWFHECTHMIKWHSYAHIWHQCSICIARIGFGIALVLCKAQPLRETGWRAHETLYAVFATSWGSRIISR